MKTFEEELDDILPKYIGASSPSYSVNDRRRELVEARQALVAAHQAEMDRVVEELIGEDDIDEYFDNGRTVIDEQMSSRNDLRDEQRARYKAIKEQQ